MSKRVLEPEEIDNRGLKKLLDVVLESVMDQYQSDKKTDNQDQIDEFNSIISAIYRLNNQLDEQETFRRRVQRKLVKYESKYLSLYNNSPDFLMSIDPLSAEIIECNNTLCQVTGYERGELIGEQIFKLYHPRCMKEAISITKLISKEKQIQEVELVFKSKIGKAIDVSMKVVAVHDKEGNFIENHLSFRDITSRKNTEKKLAAKTKELSEINNELKEFTYIASHDLKVPIANLEQILRFMTEDDLTEEEKTDLLQRAGQMIKRSKETILNLVNVTRIREKSDEEKEAINVGHLFSEIVGSFDEEIQNNGVKLSTNFKGLQNILFSPLYLKSILQNLLSNSIKYRSEDRICKINVSTYQNKEWDVIEFTDNGLGIDLALFGDKVFGMFNRFHSQKEGTGLGLYIIKQTMEKSGGKIEIKSAVGKGTTFYLFFKQK